MEPENKLSTEVTKNNEENSTFFDDKNDFVLAYKKTEKLASAVYMITGLFSDSEPMKWTLRKKVNDLLSYILTYKDVSEGAINDYVYTVKSKVTELISLLEISLRGGLISQMNFSIIRQEFFNLISILESNKSVNDKPTNESLSGKFFEVSIGQVNETKARSMTDKNTMAIGFSTSNQGMSFTELKDKTTSTHKDDLKKTNRQNTILNLIRKKGEVTIKDISLVIKDCSEKTIQRELNAFITMGLLKRSGVRRWSKYSLI